MPVSALLEPRLLIWVISAIAVGGMLVRPWKLPEAVWAVLGAACVVAGGSLPWRAAWHAMRSGLDVYLFLTGMMLLSEVARREGVFDRLAALALRGAGGSPKKLFLLVYGAGVLVTVFLSNDATAVVLTPAVCAAARAARTNALPHVLACAFVANAASFVLPISNPANLVFYARDMPSLLDWFSRFGFASLVALLATCVLLMACERSRLTRAVATDALPVALTGSGKLALAGLTATAAALIGASAAGVKLGLPTTITGIATASLVLASKREAPWGVLGGVSWAVLPLVAGLFVLVEAVGTTGARDHLAALLGSLGPWQASAGIAVLSNIANNLPAGLLASQAALAAHAGSAMRSALLVGVDLGPNFSISGSLATILWLTALRREGIDIGFWGFAARGVIVTPPALILALAACQMSERLNPF